MPKDNNISYNFNQLYNNTCVYFRKKGESVWLGPGLIKSVQTVGPNDSTDFEVYIQKKSSSITTHTVVVNYGEYEFNLNLPKIGLVNIDGYSVAHSLSKQVANKQYSRGFGSGYFRLHPSILYMVNDTYMKRFTEIRYNMHFISELFTNGSFDVSLLLHVYERCMNRKWFSPKEALQMLENSHLSVALSLNWQMVASRRNDRCAEICHGMFPVGYFTSPEEVVIKQYYIQEFNDLLNRNGYSLNVKAYQ